MENFFLFDNTDYRLISNSKVDNNYNSNYEENINNSIKNKAKSNSEFAKQFDTMRVRNLNEPNPINGKKTALDRDLQFQDSFSKFASDNMHYAFVFHHFRHK